MEPVYKTSLSLSKASTCRRVGVESTYERSKLVTCDRVPVVLKYRVDELRKEGFTFCRSDSDNYFLIKIEPLNVVSRPPTQVDAIPLSKPDITQELLKQNQMMIINQQEMLEEMRKQRMNSERNKY